MRGGRAEAGAIAVEPAMIALCGAVVGVSNSCSSYRDGMNDCRRLDRECQVSVMGGVRMLVIACGCPGMAIQAH